MTFLKKCILMLINTEADKTQPNFNLLSDEDLVKKINDTQNTLLFSTLYDRYSKKVYNKCYSFVNNEDEAKDLTQDVFLKLFTKLYSFKGNSKFSTWLYAFTYNFCVNYVKRDTGKRINSISKPLDKNDYHLSEIEEIEDQTLFDLKTSKLDIALSMIEPDDKAILLLKYQDDVSIKDLQATLQIGESAVKMRLKRAKVKVIEAYNKIE